MSRLLDRLRTINAEWNDLPHRLMWFVALFLGLYALLWAFAYVAPFALAALLAWMIEPAVRFVSGFFPGKRLARNIASAVLVVLVTVLVIVLLFALIGRVFEEVKALAIALPGWVGTATTDIIAWFDGLELDWAFFEKGLEETVMRLVADAASMLTSLASRMASTAARYAWRAVGFLPQGILFVVLMLMGTFYMSADRERIFSFLRGLLPEKYQKKSNLFRASFLRAILGQLRAGVIMLLVTFGELSAGFLLMGLDYAILFALVIAVLDALPVIGAGLFLLPMCAVGIVIGNATLAVGAGLMYLTTIVVRQLLEPRIIGRQLGLYPLATMMAMYGGLRAMGVFGMLLGPLMLLLCKVALTADPDLAAEAATRKPLLRRKKKG